MKIAVIIPDRGDRPLFLENCLRMLKAQTVQPDIIELVAGDILNFCPDGYVQPTSNECDITLRYRIGYDRLRKKGIDVIFPIENDDWYSPVYIETMLREWEKYQRPDIFGTNNTTYYHIKERGYFSMNHAHRSAMFSTLIKPDLKFDWCKDTEPYTDLHLWKTVKPAITFKPEKYICMGIKHGIGMCGGHGHTDRLQRYQRIQDKDFKFLKSVMDEASFNFYSNYFS